MATGKEKEAHHEGRKEQFLTSPAVIQVAADLELEFQSFSVMVGRQV